MNNSINRNNKDTNDKLEDYKSIMSDCKKKSYIDSLLIEYEPYAPKNFKKRLQSGNLQQIKALLWEALLSVELVKNGCVLVHEGLHSSDRPDICIDLGDGKRCWIECGIPSIPKGYNDSVNFFFKGSNDDHLLRIGNLLVEKKKQYNRWLKKGIVRKDQLFVLAINGCNLKFSIKPGFGRPFMAALYPIGSTVVSFGKEDNFRYLFRDSLSKQKEDGIIPVSNNAFLINDYTFISGLLYAENLPPFDHARAMCLNYVNNMLAERNIGNIFKKIAKCIEFYTDKNGHIAYRYLSA